ncbi:MAG: type II secretion system protein F [Gordonia sp. (in: high G+C Gram-positive bacteria)]
MTTVLLAVACAVSWWDGGPARHRIRALAGPGDRQAFAHPLRVITGVAVVSAAVVGGLPAALAAGIVVGVLAWRSRRRRRAEAADRRRDDLLTALSLMIGELAVGAPPARACASAGAEMAQGRSEPGEVAAALTRTAGRAELGGGVLVEDEVAARLHSWDRITTAWQISERYGLPLADLLAEVREDLLARKAFAERTRAGLAGPRATATVLAGLPVLGVALGQATGADPVQVLASGGLGGILLVAGTALAGAGLMWSERIADKAVAP